MNWDRGLLRASVFISSLIAIGNGFCAFRACRFLGCDSPLRGRVLENLYYLGNPIQEFISQRIISMESEDLPGTAFLLIHSFMVFVLTYVFLRIMIKYGKWVHSGFAKQ